MADLAAEVKRPDQADPAGHGRQATSKEPGRHERERAGREGSSGTYRGRDLAATVEKRERG